jgi:hypothetical protein
MKALWFLPFTYAAGAEGFALFVPYLLCLLATLYVLRALRQARQAAPVPVVSASNEPRPQIGLPLDAHPAV